MVVNYVVYGGKSLKLGMQVIFIISGEIHVYKVSYFSLIFTGDGVALKTPQGGNLPAIEALSFYPFFSLLDHLE